MTLKVNQQSQKNLYVSDSPKNTPPTYSNASPSSIADKVVDLKPKPIGQENSANRGDRLILFKTAFCALLIFGSYLTRRTFLNLSEAHSNGIDDCQRTRLISLNQLNSTACLTSSAEMVNTSSIFSDTYVPDVSKKSLEVFKNAEVAAYSINNLIELPCQKPCIDYSRMSLDDVGKALIDASQKSDEDRVTELFENRADITQKQIESALYSILQRNDAIVNKLISKMYSISTDFFNNQKALFRKFPGEETYIKLAQLANIADMSPETATNVLHTSQLIGNEVMFKMLLQKKPQIQAEVVGRALVTAISTKNEAMIINILNIRKDIPANFLEEVLEDALKMGSGEIINLLKNRLKDAMDFKSRISDYEPCKSDPCKRILMAVSTHDEDGGFRDYETIARSLDLLSYDVKYIRISDLSDICNELMKQEKTPKIQQIALIMAHGTDYQIQLGPNYTINKWHKPEIIKKCFSNADSIILESCDTGSDMTSYPIAQWLADVSEKTVLAPRMRVITSTSNYHEENGILKVSAKMGYRAGEEFSDYKTFHPKSGPSTQPY